MTIEGNEYIRVVTIGNRRICVKGVGKLFFQEGFPIPMAVSELSKKGIEVSLLHIADELLKENWNPDKIVKRLQAEMDDVIYGDLYIIWDWHALKRFVYKDYEDQRQMIFDYLWSNEEFAKQELTTLF